MPCGCSSVPMVHAWRGGGLSVNLSFFFARASTWFWSDGTLALAEKDCSCVCTLHNCSCKALTPTKQTVYLAGFTCLFEMVDLGQPVKLLLSLGRCPCLETKCTSLLIVTLSRCWVTTGSWTPMKPGELSLPLFPIWGQRWMAVGDRQPRVV